MDYTKYLEKMNFKELTPVQKQTIKAFKTNKNIIGVAPTGTGKTHAYLLPIIENIDLSKEVLQAVILLPTNELIHQVKMMLTPLITDGLKVKAYDSKINKSKEVLWLTKNQPQVILTTPEKLLDFSNMGLLLKSTKYLVLDEADMMFDEAFLKQIDQILTKTTNAKYLLFSATITLDMYSFIGKYFGSYELIDTTKDHNLKIEQRLVKSKLDNRDETLKDILKSINPFLCIIFISKKENQREVFDLLHEMDLNVGLLSSDLNQHQRKNMIADIRSLKYQYIVASDLASRGLDFDVSHVINYDLPYKLEFFKHRSGRTGRMNKDGIVITIALNSDRHKIKRLVEMGFEFNEYRIAKNEMILIDTNKVENKLTVEELSLMKKIAKPTKVKPNYRKKNKEKILKAKKQARRQEYAKNR